VSPAGWTLPRGQHKLPREVVVENQRSRLLAAAAQAVAEHGYASLSVEHIISLAGTSRSTFYANFDDKRDCVLVAHGEVFDRLASAIHRACASQHVWPQKVAAAVRASLDFAVESPEEARLLLFDVLGVDRELAAHVRASNDHLVGMLRAGREHSTEAAALPELTERAMVGAASSIIANRLMREQAEELRRIEPELVELMLVPYTGAEEARRIARASTRII
jgi:AcrR family transcriptional regulator